MKFLKIFLSIITLLFLVISMAILGIYLLVNPNQFKSTIAAEIKHKTGYQVTIPEDLQWSFYPRFSLYFKNLQLTAPTQTTPFLQLQDVYVSTTLSQLWNKDQWKAKLFVKNAKFATVQLQNITTVILYKNDNIVFSPLHSELYEGIFNGEVVGNNMTAMPTWQSTFAVSHINIKKLLRDLNPEQSAWLAGVGNLTAKLATSGKTQNQLLANLTGIGEFAVTNGYLFGTDFNFLIETAEALINKQAIKLNPTTNLNQTSFERLQAAAIFNNGMAQINDLTFTSPTFMAQGTGTLQLQTQIIHLPIKISSQQNLKLQWNIPLLIAGQLHHPEIRIEMNTIQRMQAQIEIEKLKEKARDQVQKHVHGEVGQLLQNLLRK